VAVVRAGRDLYAHLPHRNGAIVFIGDSITEGCPWDELLQRPVLNQGIGGDTVRHGNALRCAKRPSTATLSYDWHK
jgi:hypothetical protein